MADTPTARNIAPRWSDNRRSARFADQTAIVVLNGRTEARDVQPSISIHHLPVPIVQIDTSRLRTLIGGVKAAGAAETLIWQNIWQASLFVADANETAVSLLQAHSTDDLAGPANYLFSTSPRTVDRMISAWIEGKRSFSEPMTVRTFKGALLDIRLSVTFPSPDSPDPLLVVLEDITERCRLERQFQQQETDPLHTARLAMLGRLATSIAHEVNQPLATIVTDCETTMRHLQRDEPNIAKVKALAARIASSAERASEIVKRVRGMASSRPGTPVALDLNEIVMDALSFVRHEIDTHAISLSVNCAYGLPAFLGDRIQVQQVVVNLLVNAIEATVSGDQQDRRIEIATIEADHRIQFAIRDSGDGVSTDDLGRIFNCFYTTKENGVGVGLSICQSIVLDHGGDIYAANVSDGGALFSFSLPIHFPTGKQADARRAKAEANR